MSRISVGSGDLPESVDVVVAGLGITGAGVALDAASRGLRVLAVDAHDLAFGTSRWSSKLVHGGLRYLAHGQVGIAHESAVERGLLMDVIAPHLTHPLPMLTPLHDGGSRMGDLITWGGLRAGDVLRRTARTSTRTLPRPRRLNATEVLNLVPSLRAEGLRGGFINWDGQLEDDARLVTAVARTAVAQGAHVHTRVRVLEASGTHALLRDELTGVTHRVETRAVVNATGVWAGSLAEDVHLRPSRGTHLVLHASTLPRTSVAVMVAIPGHFGRFAFVLPQPDGRLYVGLTDEAVEGPVPDVPEPSEEEISFLLEVVGPAFEHAPTREDVVGAYAGLRPLLHADGQTADLSRKHAVLTSRNGVVTVVGGKLTTYRQMAEDAVDRVVESAGLDAAPCRTRTLGLLGAAPRDELSRLQAPRRLVRRFGTEADLVLRNAREVTGLGDDELLEPVDDTIPVTLAELIFAVTHEGAHDVEDLLDRRTRVGLVASDRRAAEPVARRALTLAAPPWPECDLGRISFAFGSRHSADTSRPRVTEFFPLGPLLTPCGKGPRAFQAPNSHTCHKWGTSPISRVPVARQWGIPSTFIERCGGGDAIP